MTLSRIIVLWAIVLGLPGLALAQTDSVRFDYDKAIKVAQNLAVNRQFADARLLAERVIHDRPDYIDARIILGNSYYWEGYAALAREEYYKVFQYDNGNKLAFQALITLEIGEGRPERAAEIAKMALDFHPDDQEIWMSYARASQLSANFLEAKRALLTILEKDPSNQEARSRYANLMKEIPVSTEGNIVPGIQGPYDIREVDTVMVQAWNFAANEMIDEARSLCNQVLSRIPDYIPARLLIAETHAWNNEFEQARAELRKIRAEENGHRETLLAWVRTETWAKNYNTAIQYCNIGLKFYPTDEEFLLKKAQVYEAAENYFEAKRTLFTYLAANPGDIRFRQKYVRLVDKQNQQIAKSLKPVFLDTTMLPKGIEDMLYDARQLAYSDDFDGAKSVCYQVLQVVPDYFGALLLLGNILSWEGKFEESVQIMAPLIKVAFDSKDLIQSLADSEMWAENFDEASRWIRYGLDIYPGEPELLYRQAMVYQRTGDVTLAAETLGALVARIPDNKVYRQAYYSVRGPLQINGMSAEYTFNRYKLPIVQSWNMFGVKYYLSDKRGTLIGSLNTGFYRTDTTAVVNKPGIQFELDAFPVFPNKKSYLHINLGLSPSSIFARQKLGLHGFYEFRKDWEISGGFNYMNYRDSTDTVKVFIADAAISHYFKNYMASGGISFAPANGKLAQGYALTLRRFLKTPEDWIQISVGTGLYPDNPLNYLYDPTYLPNQALKNYYVLFAGRYWFTQKLIGRIYAGYQYEEYRQTLFRNTLTLNLALIFLFKD